MASELSMDCVESSTRGAETTTPPMTPQAAGTVSPVEEYKQVEPLMAAPLKAGSSYFLVNRRWYTEWLQWVGHPSMQSPHMRPAADPVLGTPESFESPSQTGGNSAKRTRTRSWTKDRPGKIDNSELLEEEGGSGIKRSLDERADYEIIPEDAWELFLGWYGGGPPIKRRAIELPEGGVQVELYGLSLKVYKSSDINGQPLQVVESKTTTVKELKATLCRELDLDSSKVRMWDYFNKRTYALLEKSEEDLDRTLDACRILDDNPILLEEQKEDGTWPYKEEGNNDANDIVGTSSGAGYGSSYSSTMYGGAEVQVGAPIQRGVVGLQNLGNTCFMNSSIQCLSNIPPLRDYFLSKDLKESINYEAHKTKGKLAEGFSDLLHMMWREDTTRVAPRNFKWQVGQFAEQFSGYGQQDSMELIEYVLDGLKEDCNQVHGPKPYVELKEADGRSDHEVAAEALDAYRKRSNSKVDDLFVGLFKSVVRCPEESCNRVSVTFDPFLSAKLPLASPAAERMKSFCLTLIRNVVPSSGNCIEEVKVNVNKHAAVKELIAAVVKEVGEDLLPEKCILVEVWNKKVHKFFEDGEAVNEIRAEDQLLLFEVADAKAFHIATEQRWGTSFSFGSSALAACSGENSNGDTSPGCSSCGAIFHQRSVDVSGSKATSSWGMYNRREMLGLPLLMSIPKEASARELYEEVRRRIRELVLDPDAPEPPAWKILRVDKSGHLSDGELLEQNSDESLGMEAPREYFVIEWEECQSSSALPKKLTQDNFVKCDDATPSTSSVELTKLLDIFVEDEQLGSDDAWYCNQCKEHKEAWKKLEFHRCPPVLVLQLKRFQYTRWTRERLNTAVNFPLEGLDLAPYCTPSSRSIPDPEPTVYDLAATSKHIGSLGGGHYVAYCRSSLDGEWYFFDDGSVRRCSVEEVESDKVGAYVLFYIRRDFRPSSFSQLQQSSP
eukprot:TRINITY_DN48405_c0_g1_i1.p1 TRINITY_DN48405_c0_g1~~TRINITY_DN48405_c0_g1_i1.p1  ORF type:complete len:949 (+),score=190.68 TRINITY_DN48405_c0_g1_i1:116-2962(+)